MDLELDTRKRIYELIRRSPGIHLRELERRLDMVMGSLQYHLHYLEKNDFIRSSVDGEYVRYFVKDRKLGEKDRKILSVLRRKGCLHILINLLQKSGMNNKDLAGAIGLSPSTTSWHLNKLLNEGIIERTNAGRSSNFNIRDPEIVAGLIIYYKESFLDGLLDNFTEMWDLRKQEK
ncbi:winged helix-turn-helix transcriptional regulator [Methanococcoides sp. FTZ1]|uniref:winged helix-turn-helix transcriptional regulator n=1 Tax=Methanococcoides sp. FTZ1 TaxID=3439061 RepID=UPI003F835B2D